MLSFDFYLPEQNILIEFDGKQHYSASGKGWNNWKKLVDTNKRDVIKNAWCIEQGLPLIRIPYTAYDHINQEYLLELIKTAIDTQANVFVPLREGEKDMRPERF